MAVTPYSPPPPPPSEGMDLGRQLSSLPSMDSGELDLLMSMIAEPGGGGGGEPPLPWHPAPARPAPARRPPPSRPGRRHGAAGAGAGAAAPRAAAGARPARTRAPPGGPESNSAEDPPRTHRARWSSAGNGPRSSAIHRGSRLTELETEPFALRRFCEIRVGLGGPRPREVLDTILHHKRSTGRRDRLPAVRLRIQ